MTFVILYDFAITEILALILNFSFVTLVTIINISNVYLLKSFESKLY
jgi:hypothetical protein